MGSSLEHPDFNSFYFVQELLEGDFTTGLDMDRLQKHSSGFIVWEFLLTDEKQTISPWDSHPRNYWHLNKNKFITLFKISKKLDAKLLLVNYAKLGTLHEDKVLVIWVHDLDPNGIQKESIYRLSRLKFKEWFKKLNKESTK